VGTEKEIRDDIKQSCREELPDYTQPISYVFRESLPLTSVGKIDYRALEKQAEEMR